MDKSILNRDIASCKDKNTLQARVKLSDPPMLVSFCTRCISPFPSFTYCLCFFSSLSDTFFCSVLPYSPTIFQILVPATAFIKYKPSHTFSNLFNVCSFMSSYSLAEVKKTPFIWEALAPWTVLWSPSVLACRSQWLL